MERAQNYRASGRAGPLKTEPRAGPGPDHFQKLGLRAGPGPAREYIFGPRAEPGPSMSNVGPKMSFTKNTVFHTFITYKDIILLE